MRTFSPPGRQPTRTGSAGLCSTQTLESSSVAGSLSGVCASRGVPKQQHRGGLRHGWKSRGQSSRRGGEEWEIFQAVEGHGGQFGQLFLLLSHVRGLV